MAAASTIPARIGPASRPYHGVADCQARIARSVTPRRRASAAANRNASKPDSESSTPTTTRGERLVLMGLTSRTSSFDGRAG
jgi:hypothetical protein